MKKAALAFSLLALLSLPMSAQVFGVGMQIGRAQSADHGFDFKLDDSFKQAFFTTQIEPLTNFKLVIGQTDTNNEFALTDGGVAANDGRIEYVDAAVEYRFSEVFGSTGLFAGPGFYRQHYGDYNETSYGLTAGVNGEFPVTQRLSLIAEAGYHWAHFDRDRRFIAVSGGFKFAF